MQTATNPFQAVNEIFFKPNGAFNKIAHSGNWSWIPFLIVITLSVLPIYLYFNFVDFEWYKSLIMSIQLGDVSPAEQENYARQLQPNVVKWSSVIGAFVGIIMVNAILAGYLTLVTRADEKSVQGFLDWYGFTWWVALPTIFSSLIALVLIALANDHQLSPEVMSPLSISYIFNVDPESAWFSFTQSVRLDMFWSIYLIAVGLAQWTNLHTRKAWLTAIAPYAIVYSTWFIFTLL